MAHWLGYHSQRKMGYPYRDTGTLRFYFNKYLKQVQPGDWIWVVEGDLAGRFSLSDCFAVDTVELGPFEGAAAGYRARALASKSLLRFPISLNRGDHPWFASVHERWLTKQRFFELLDREPELVAAFKRLANL